MENNGLNNISKTEAAVPKNKKKIIISTVSIILAVIFLFVGCRKNNSSSDDSSSYVEIIYETIYVDGDESSMQSSSFVDKKPSKNNSTNSSKNESSNVSKNESLDTSTNESSNTSKYESSSTSTYTSHTSSKNNAASSENQDTAEEGYIDKDILKVCSFNVGMWTNGTQKGVLPEDITESSNEIKKFLTNENIDIFLGQEARRYFDKNGTIDAYDYNFKQHLPYHWKTTSTQWHYAVREFLPASKYSIKNVEVHNFKDPQSERAYITFEFNTKDGKVINFILCHLSYESNTTGPRQSELAELSELLGTYQYGVIAGDFNVFKTSEYDTYFSNFNMANHGEFGDFETWVNDAYKISSKCLDNIITTKSISLSDVHLGDIDMSDHIPIIATLTLN